jgi:chaperonin cofactor prefoldin
MNELPSVFKATDSKLKVDMSLDIKDIFDVLVTEQEQLIENQITTLKQQSEQLTKRVEQADKDADSYMEKFVQEKFDSQIRTLTDTLKLLTPAAVISTEITDGNILPKKRRPRLVYDPTHENRDNIVVVSLTITNKEMDRNTLNNAVTFFVEAPFDEHLVKLVQDREDLTKQKYEVNKQISELERRLEQTDRLLRRAKATLTKKALGKDLDDLLNDVRTQFPNLQIEGVRKE